MLGAISVYCMIIDSFLSYSFGALACLYQICIYFVLLANVLCFCLSDVMYPGQVALASWELIQGESLLDLPRLPS